MGDCEVLVCCRRPGRGPDDDRPRGFSAQTEPFGRLGIVPLRRERSRRITKLPCGRVRRLQRQIFSPPQVFRARRYWPQTQSRAIARFAGWQMTASMAVRMSRAAADAPRSGKGFGGLGWMMSKGFVAVHQNLVAAFDSLGGIVQATTAGTCSERAYHRVARAAACRRQRPARYAGPCWPFPKRPIARNDDTLVAQARKCEAAECPSNWCRTRRATSRMSALAAQILRPPFCQRRRCSAGQRFEKAVVTL